LDGHQIGGNSSIHVVNEVNAFDTAGITAIAHSYGHKGVKDGITIPERVRNQEGIDLGESGFSPYRNFTASDANRAVNWVGGIPEYVRVQIHELGNSLSLITGNQFSSFPKENDQDAGQAFQNCVRDELAKGSKK